MAIKRYSTFPKLQHYWNLIIRFFSVISRILVGWVSYYSAEKQLVYSAYSLCFSIVSLSIHFYIILSSSYSVFGCQWICCILTFDPAKHGIPKTAEVTHSDGSYGKKSRRRAWLTIWDKVKSQCTGREWPVICITVISAWWWSNMPFQRLSGQWNYYITWWRQEVS